MDNMNTPEYLEKTRNIILENLRNLQHAPSVQMQRKCSGGGGESSG